MCIVFFGKLPTWVKKSIQKEQLHNFLYCVLINRQYICHKVSFKCNPYVTVAQSRSCSESVVITKSKKYNVITLWLRKIVVILMQYSMLLPFQENLVPHNNKQNKTQSQSSHWIFWTGMPCRGVDYQTKIKILWWNNQTCLNIWPKLWEFFFCESFSFVMILLVLPLTRC